MREERPLSRKVKAIIAMLIIIAIALIWLCSGNCKGCVGNDESSNTSIGGEVSSSTVSSEYTSSEVQSNSEPEIRGKVKAIVTIGNRVSIYGNPIKDLEWTAEILEGNIGIEELNKYLVISKQGENTVGEYPIVGECLKADWEITFVEGKYTIYPRDITVVVDDQESYVGDKIKPLTYRLKGQLVGDDKAEDLFSIETTATGKSIGTFDITVNAKDTPNYHVTTTNGVYTVKNKPSTSQPSNPSDTSKPDQPSNPEKTEPVVATVSIDDLSSTYGDAIKKPTWSVKIVSGNVTVNELNKFITVTMAEGNEAGLYEITGKCSKSDWKVTFVEGTYTILPRSIKVKANDQESYVGDKLKSLTYKLEGKLAGNDKAEDLFWLETKATGNKAGKFDIVIKQKGNKNYRITSTNGVYTVKDKDTSQPSQPSQPDKPKPVIATVTINNLSSTYGDPIKKPTWSVKITSGNVTVDELNKSITVTKESGNVVGKYRISGKCSKSDWEVTFIEGTYTIVPRNLTVTADNQESYVGDSLKSLTYRLDGKLVGGDTAESLFAIETKATGKVAGKFDITVNVKGNANYRITTKNGVYTVMEKPAKPGVPSDDPNESESGSKPGENETPAKPGIPSDDDEESKPSESETPKPGLPDDNESETPAKPGLPGDSGNESETPTRPGQPGDNESETPARPGVPTDDETETPTRPARSSIPSEMNPDDF